MALLSDLNRNSPKSPMNSPQFGRPLRDLCNATCAFPCLSQITTLIPLDLGRFAIEMEILGVIQSVSDKTSTTYSLYSRGASIDSHLIGGHLRGTAGRQRKQCRCSLVPSRKPLTCCRKNRWYQMIERRGWKYRGKNGEMFKHDQEARLRNPGPPAPMPSRRDLHARGESELPSAYKKMNLRFRKVVTTMSSRHSWPLSCRTRPRK